MNPESPGPAARYSPARQLLRNATHADHVRLNQHPLLKGIGQPDYSYDMYRTVLAAYFHFYRALETAIDRCIASHAIPFDYETRRKLPWIGADLAYFGIDPECAPWCPQAPLAAIDLDSEGALVGALYTIEGSTLGGQVISRQIGANLGLQRERGGRFFHAYGDAIGPMWNAFEDYLNLTLARLETHPAARSAARRTFAALEDHLDEYHLRLHA